MSTATVARAEPYNVAVIGPRGHGKTMLAACLVHAQPRTGTRDPLQALVANAGDYRGRWSGSPPAEHWHYRTARPTPFRFATATRAYTGFDGPGLAKLARRNASLLTSMDAVVIVVSPLELETSALGLLHEQLSVAHHVGVGSVVVFLNKCDHFESVADADEVCGAAETRVRELTAACGFSGERVAFTRGAAGPEAGGDRRLSGAATGVMGALDACPTPLRAPDAPLLFPVFRGFRITGRGPVAAGIIARGRIAEGEQVRVVGARRSWFNRKVAVTAFDSEVLSLRELDQPCSHAQAGAAAGALLLPRAGADWRAAYEICHGVTIVGRGVDGADGAVRFAGRFRFLGPPHATHRAGAAVTLALPMYLEVGMRLFVRRDQIVALGEVTSLAP